MGRSYGVFIVVELFSHGLGRHPVLQHGLAGCCTTCSNRVPYATALDDQAQDTPIDAEAIVGCVEPKFLLIVLMRLLICILVYIACACLRLAPLGGRLWNEQVRSLAIAEIAEIAGRLRILGLLRAFNAHRSPNLLLLHVRFRNISKVDGLVVVLFPNHYRFSGVLIDDNRLITSAGSQPVGELRRVALDAGLVLEDLLLCQNGVTG
jgi:hypothetical protein